MLEHHRHTCVIVVLDDELVEGDLTPDGVKQLGVIADRSAVDHVLDVGDADLQRAELRQQVLQSVLNDSVAVVLLAQQEQPLAAGRHLLDCQAEDRQRVDHQVVIVRKPIFQRLDVIRW